MPPNTVLIPLVICLGVLLIWLPLMMTAVLFSGWWELSRLYPVKPPAPAARRGVGSVYFSPIFRYKNFVVYAIDDDHLHLRLPPLVGALHAPISIPWCAIELPTDQPSPSGMATVLIEGRRIFVSRAMVTRELELRRMIPPTQSVS